MSSYLVCTSKVYYVNPTNTGRWNVIWDQQGLKVWKTCKCHNGNISFFILDISITLGDNKDPVNRSESENFVFMIIAKVKCISGRALQIIEVSNCQDLKALFIVWQLSGKKSGRQLAKTSVLLSPNEHNSQSLCDICAFRLLHLGKWSTGTLIQCYECVYLCFITMQLLP